MSGALINRYGENKTILLCLCQHQYLDATPNAAAHYLLTAGCEAHMQTCGRRWRLEQESDQVPADRRLNEIAPLDVSMAIEAVEDEVEV